MLATFLAHAGLQTISMEIPGRPLFEVLAKLEPLANEKLLPSAEIKHLPLILKVTNKPWSEVKRQIAWATWATWVERDGKWFLERTKANRDEYANYQFEKRKEYLKPFFEGVVKRARLSGDWQKEASVGLDPVAVAAYGKSFGLTRKLLAQIGQDALAREPDVTIWTFPARPNEQPFPNGCAPIIIEIIEDFNLRLKPKEAITQMAIVQQSVGNYYLLLAYASGKVRASYGDSITGGIQPKTVRMAETFDVHVSPLVENRIGVGRLNPVSPTKASAELIEALLNPVKTDPLELDAGPILIDIATRSGLNLVANLSHPLSLRRLIGMMPLPFSNTQVVNEVANRNHLELGTEWLRIRESSYTLTPAMDRTVLKSHLLAAWNAKSPDDLADRLFASTAWPVRHQLEFTNAVQLLFPPSQMPAKFLPLQAHFANTRAPFRRSVRLSSEERKQVYSLLMENTDSVFIPGPIIEGLQTGTMLEVTLEMLPTRLFPIGIPADIEIQFEPGTGDYSRAIMFGLNEQMDEPKTLYTHGYAKHLVDVKALSVSKQYKWFREQGSAGGEIVYRFPNRAQLKIYAGTWATQPNAKARPVAELPELFMKRVKEYVTEFERARPLSKPPPR